jgi:hypothetical protein
MWPGSTINGSESTSPATEVSPSVTKATVGPLIEIFHAGLLVKKAPADVEPHCSAIANL